LLTHRQTDKQTKSGKKHYLLGGGKYDTQTHTGVSQT